jgi:redox-regulated HSP33 family molecular chaperone
MHKDQTPWLGNISLIDQTKRTGNATHILSLQCAVKRSYCVWYDHTMASILRRHKHGFISHQPLVEAIARTSLMTENTAACREQYRGRIAQEPDMAKLYTKTTLRAVLSRD